MPSRVSLCLFALLCVLPSLALAGPVQPATAHTFVVRDGKFLLDGKPFVIRAGEIHYPRIPPTLWRHRLKMAKAMGLNTISAYVFWNIHEPEKGRFRFSGDADVARFIRIAAEEGLYVLLRPGPYVCAEWEFGGFPYWLLRDTSMTVRSRDPKFLACTDRYFEELGKRLGSLQADRGGNILMVQVENEYGSYGNDKVYMAAIRDSLRKAGFTVPLFTADGPSQMPAGYVTGVLPGLNGVTGPDVKRTIDPFQPGGPYLAPEVYPGWLDHWGEPFSRVEAKNTANALTWFLQNNVSFSLYMFHGGTNFGFLNGANFGGNYEPHTTTYDYDAPLDEAGRPTAKYRLLRETMAKLVSETFPPIPETTPVIPVPRFSLTASGSLSGIGGRPVRSASPLTMEALGQDYGYVLYRTQVKGPSQERLTLKDLRDFAVVMVNGKTVGTLDRRRKQQGLVLNLPAGNATLEILVENGGRINYGPLLTDNRKGITERVLLGEEELKGWEMISLPMRDPSHSSLDGKAGGQPTLYRGAFSLEKVGDTFLDMRGWTKGAVWVNGHALGRYWNIGPQQTLYLPAPWLRKGQNEIIVFEMIETKSPSVVGLTEPILDVLTPEKPLEAHAPRPKWSVLPQPGEAERVAQGEFSDRDTPQDIVFPPMTGRFICLESTSAHDNGPFASCAELFLLGKDGKPLKRGQWKVIATDSEEDLAEDGYADNLLDDDTATIWHTIWGRPYTGHPHRVVIDLGREQEFAGFRYVSRAGNKPGKIKGFRFYASKSPFGAKP